MRRHPGGKASARRRALHSLAVTPGIRIEGGFHKPTPIVRALGPHLFQALSCKATWMLQRRLRGTRFAKMSPNEREAPVLKIATEISSKVEARMIASGACHHA